MSASKTSYSQFKTNVNARVFPFGVPDNLIAIVPQLITEALILVQRYAPCHQKRHVDIHDSTTGVFTNFGATYLTRPRGKILRIQNRYKEDRKDVFTYLPATRDQVEINAKEVRDLTLTCRLRFGYYHDSHGRIAVTPELQDNEELELHWSGIKRSFSDKDLLPDDPELFSAVCSYVEREMARKYDIDTEKFKLSDEAWRTGLAEVIHDCHEHGIDVDYGEQDTMMQDLVFAFVGNTGASNDDQSSVAALIQSWTPNLILLGGDNVIGSVGDFDTALAAYQNEITRGIVKPALGDADLDIEDGAAQTRYFNLPGNGRYYQFRIGEVEFFCLNSGINGSGSVVESDGNTQASTQGQWLKTALDDSEAPWKVVYLHHPPYGTGNQADLQWDFKGWGADIVLSGGPSLYERIHVSDFPFINAGTGGGRALASNLSTDSNIVLQKNTDFGAIRAAANGTRLLLKFYSASGDLMDVYAINK